MYIIRNWYVVSDDFEIGVMDWIRFLMEMRDLLMDGVDFFVFFFVGRYIKDILIIIYEGI